MGFWTSLVFALAPGIFLIIWFYHKDKWDPEPLYLVLKAFFAGVFIVFPAMIIEHFLSPLFVGSGLFLIFLQAFLGVSLVEEGFKHIITRRFVLNKECDERYDGILYGVVAALGFASLENVFYIFMIDTSFITIIGRALLAVPLHALCGAVMGYYLAERKLLLGWVPFFVRPALFWPIFFHGLYDFLLFIKVAWGIFAVIGLMWFLWKKVLAEIKVANEIDAESRFLDERRGIRDERDI